MSTWIIQRKLARSDWETIALREGCTRVEALDAYQHMNGRLRAVSEQRALSDYEAGRADDYRRCEAVRAGRDYESYLERRGMSEQEHVSEIDDYVDSLD